jgi:hypothetical protein
LPLHLGRPLDAVRHTGNDGFVSAVVVSHDLWQRRLHGDPAAIGRHIEVNNLNVEVVGVLRPDFRMFLPANSTLPEVVDVWFPTGFETDRRSRGQITIARLAPGVSIDEAQARLDALGQRFMADHAADYADGRLRLSVRPLQDVLTASVRRALWVLAGAVAFVLLIGCVNVGNLMLARARQRGPEMTGGARSAPRPDVSFAASPVKAWPWRLPGARWGLLPPRQRASGCKTCCTK